MTRRFADSIQAALERDTYEPFLDGRGRVRWRESRDGEEIIWTHEPKTSFMQRLVANFMRLLPIRGQL